MKGHLYLVEAKRANDFANIIHEHNKIGYWRQPLKGITVNGREVTAFYFDRRDYKVTAILAKSTLQGIYYYYDGYIE